MRRDATRSHSVPNARIGLGNEASDEFFQNDELTRAERRAFASHFEHGDETLTDENRVHRCRFALHSELQQPFHERLACGSWRRLRDDGMSQARRRHHRIGQSRFDTNHASRKRSVRELNDCILLVRYM